MAKYSNLLCLSYLFTIICLLPCLGKLDSNGVTCSDKQYGEKNEKGDVTCISCDNLPTCPHGLGVSISCGDVVPKGTDIHCVHCIPGKTFSKGQDNLPCKQCHSSLCHRNEKILGSCKIDNDTSTCSGVCEKGFYPRDGDVSHCQPCSKCLNNTSILVKKCKDDGWPIEKQCEMVSVVMFPSEKQEPLKPGKKREKPDRYQGYQAYGHPAMFSSFVIVIFFLVLILAVVLLRRRFQKKTQRSLNRQPEQVEMPVTNGSADSGIHETDSFNVSNETIVETVRKRKSSLGFNGRKVSFSRQISSNSNAASEETEDLLSSVEVSGENDVFQEEPLQRPERKRTLSQGSSGRRSRIFSRQNSNPIPEHSEAPFHKRSSTFSNFSTILSGQQKGDKEETTSLLSGTDQNDNDIAPLVVPADSKALRPLSGVKVGELNAEIHRQLCDKLNLRDVTDDWRTLAGRMGYSNDEVRSFAQDNNPAAKLLTAWDIRGAQNDVSALIELVRDMNRGDVLELLESDRAKAKFVI